MAYTFSSTQSFDQDLAWNTTSVTTMNGMFLGAIAFNGKISGFKIEKVVDLSDMVRPRFGLCVSFNMRLNT